MRSSPRSIARRSRLGEARLRGVQRASALVGCAQRQEREHARAAPVSVITAIEALPNTQ